VITGRGPGAPGMAPGMEFTRGRVAAGGPGSGAVDLGEIRRSDEIIGVLAARAAPGPPMLRDPAASLLSALTADVDARDAGPASRPGPARCHRRPGRLPATAASRRTAAWIRVGAVAAVAAGVAGTMSVVAAGTLARLARGPASGFGWPPRSWGAAARPRRAR
jgi:hypothetical protein